MQNIISRTLEAKPRAHLGPIERTIDERKSGGNLFASWTLTYDDAGRTLTELALPVPQAFTVPAFSANYDVDNRLPQLGNLAVTQTIPVTLPQGRALEQTESDPRARFFATSLKTTEIGRRNSFHGIAGCAIGAVPQFGRDASPRRPRIPL